MPLNLGPADDLVMRTMAALAFLFASLTTHAMDTSICPRHVELSYENLIPISDKKIERLRRNINPDVYPTAKKAHDEIRNTAPENVRNLSFDFQNGADGVCHYRGVHESSVEIFSRQGQEFMRVYLPLRGNDVYTVHEVTEVKTNKLKIDYRPTTALHVKVGASAFHIGWAYSLSVKL